MERTISVRGVGSLRKKPDYVTISLELEAKDMDYEKAVAASSGQIEELTAALCAVGFRMEDLKTSSYQVRTEYRSEQDENRNYRQVFDGYVCRTGMRLAFDFSVLRLGEALSAVGACSVRPELNIAFTVKDPAAAHGELLRAAAANAREKAEILCEASGVRLGKLLRVEYDWSDPAVRSRTSVSAETADLRMMKNAFQADMVPEDVELSDSAGFTWEIE